MNNFIGVDIGGTNCKVVVINENGDVLHELQTPTLASQGRDRVLANIADIINNLKSTIKQKVIAVGVTAPAVLNMDLGTIELIPNFPDATAWENFNLREQLIERTNLSIHLLNDARAATYGEKMFGAGKDYSDFISIIIGTGIGGGIISNNELFLGSRGAAGELGHQTVIPWGPRCGCGNNGCLESVASGPAITTAAIRCILQGFSTNMRSLVDGDINKVTPELVSKAAEMGDPFAIEILKDVAQYFCIVINNLKAMLNPQAIIFGGGIAQSEFLLDEIEAQLRDKINLDTDSTGNIAIKKAKFNHLAGAIGAAAWAMKKSNESVTLR
jgi:glucokinase